MLLHSTRSISVERSPRRAARQGRDQAENQAGVSAKDKIAKIAADLTERGLAAAFITDPSSVAWIFNIRGDDVPHTPHPLSRAFIKADGSAELFLDPRKTNLEVETYLRDLCEQVDPTTAGGEAGAAVRPWCAHSA